MLPSNIPILLTSSVIAYDKGVALKDTDERARLALQSVEEWLKIDPTLPLVLCDGSSFDFSEQIARRFPQARIECLPFENNQELVKRYGRGYGEGEIVRYALHHSTLIAQAGCFAKCSSKLWVENFHDCVRHWNGHLLLKGVFLNVFSPTRRTEFSYVDTRFYVASAEAYARYFEDAHLQIGKRKGYGLENSFHDIVLTQGILHSLSRVAPVICGVGGGIGTYYRNPPLRRLKEDLRLWLAKRNPAFGDLFA
jgi:hypothetical protein